VLKELADEISEPHDGLAVIAQLELGEAPQCPVALPQGDHQVHLAPKEVLQPSSSKALRPCLAQDGSQVEYAIPPSWARLGRVVIARWAGCEEEHTESRRKRAGSSVRVLTVWHCSLWYAGTQGRAGRRFSPSE
jgi:hypothetical protein